MKATATQKANAAATRADMYQEITNRFIEALKGGRIPWQKPWSGGADAARSYASGRPYSFLNQMYIFIQAADRLKETNLTEEEQKEKAAKICAGRFLTWNEAQAIEGAKIKKGCKTYQITFFKMYQPKDSNGNPQTVTVKTRSGEEEERPRLVPVLKWYRVFSEYDIDNLPAEAPEAVKILDPIKEADDVINRYVAENSPLKLEIKQSGSAYYSPRRDLVVIPERSQYSNIAEYYSTAFHELTHSTGHASRLNRLQDGAAAAFGSEDYSREELVAEMGAAMSLKRLQIDDAKAFRNSAGYIQGWLKALSNDNKMIFWAASRAERAVNWIFGDRNQEPDSNSRPETVQENGPQEPAAPAPKPEPTPAPAARPEETKSTPAPESEVKNKIIGFNVVVEKAEKIGGVITEIVQQERVYLAGSKLKHNKAEAEPVTAQFAEQEREYITEHTRQSIQAALDKKAPGKYVVKIEGYRAEEAPQAEPATPELSLF